MGNVRVKGYTFMQIMTRDCLIQDILGDLRRRKMVYLQAPCGWGKTVLLHQLEEHIGRERCTFIHNAEMIRNHWGMEHAYDLDSDSRDEIFLVDNLGEWVMAGNMDLLLNYIQNQKPESKLVLAGRIPLPAQLLPYKITSQISIYNKNHLKYSEKELDTIFGKEYKGDREQMREMYEICQGMPLFLAVAEGVLEGALIND